ncbi:hypothetical protein GBAR_LOCUS27342 [Geodia barretti]|uniref:Uncharacterized protein n=1 Tax=Geodia barretti TaxID=519541 RepID=A0AA35XG69_GEOBA|nr:hypothetical protein GBAR_LOCUS27342 [Geodia barretti]
MCVGANFTGMTQMKKAELRNALKMMVYVVVQLVEEFETDATKPDSLDIVTNKVQNLLHSSFCDAVLHQDRGAGLGRVQVQYQTLGMRPDHQVVRWWMWNSVPPFQRS